MGHPVVFVPKGKRIGVGPFCKTLANYRVTQKRYSCLIKHKLHNKRGIFKNEICFDCQ